MGGGCFCGCGGGVARAAPELALLRSREPLEAECTAVAHPRVVLDVGLDAGRRAAQALAFGSVGV